MESFKFSFVFLVFFLRVLFVIVTPQRLFALDTIGVFIYIYIYIYTIYLFSCQYVRFVWNTLILLKLKFFY